MAENRMTKQPPLTRAGEPRAFFGRREGKTLGARQRARLETLLPQLQIALRDPGPLDPADLFPFAPENLILEIGYGGGEHLARQCVANPRTGFIGAEVFSGGIGKMLEKIDTQSISNIRLFSDDALNLLQNLPDASLDGVYLLYPDPWPKSRHHKRRFVSALTLTELARVIRPEGYFRFATDIEDYANWTLAHILRQPGFVWRPGTPGSWREPFPGWRPTRYEQKARKQGRETSFYFDFRRD